MNILMAIDFPFENTGGVVTSYHEQIKALRAEGHTVYTLQMGKYDQFTSKTNTLFIKANFFLPKFLFGMGILISSQKNRIKLESLLRSHSIDYIHVQSEFSLAFGLFHAGRSLSVPVAYTIHSFFWQFAVPKASKPLAIVMKKAIEAIIKQRITSKKFDGNPIEVMLKQITYTAAEQSSVVFSPSEHQAKLIRSVGIKTPTYIVPNPFTSASKRLPIPIDISPPLRILYVGRCVPEKRPFVFLEAIKQASQLLGQDALRVEIIGDGPLLPKMKRRYRLPLISYLGAKPHEEVIEHMDQSSVVALTSYHFDNQPMIIAEAISRGRPVLYCDERLTEGLKTAGILTKSESAEDICRAIVALANDTSRLKQLANNALESQSIFSAKNYIENVTTYVRPFVKE